MPTPGNRWRHATISTHNSWLPGDERGFRTRAHKLHSSGDYRTPPPPQEHAGLKRFSKSISAAAVVIPCESRLDVLRAIRDRLVKQDHRVAAIAVAGMHAHLLVELPDDLKTIRAVIGECKVSASHAVRPVLPGRVWARDGDFKPVDTRTHYARARGYLLKHRGAWVWSPAAGERWND